MNPPKTVSVMSTLCNDYVIDYEKIREFVVRNNVKKLLIQAPDGLKPLIPCIIKDLENVDVFISSSPTYGGCDLALSEARVVDADAIIHIGHNEYPYLAYKPEIPVMYVPAYYKWRPDISLIEEIVSILKSRGINNVGLVASIQHLHVISYLEETLDKYGLKTYVGKPLHGLFKGQILGCDYSSALQISDQVEGFLVIAGGRFHALGLSLVVEKPVFQIDPYREEVREYIEEKRKILRNRFFIVNKIVNSIIKSIAIILGSLPGQYRLGLAKHISSLAKEMGFKPYSIVSTYLTMERLIAIDNALKADLYVVTSCPRLPLDDLTDFYKPVLTPGEFYMIYRYYKDKRMPEKYIYPW